MPWLGLVVVVIGAWVLLARHLINLKPGRDGGLVGWPLFAVAAVLSLLLALEHPWSGPSWTPQRDAEIRASVAEQTATLEAERDETDLARAHAA